MKNKTFISVVGGLVVTAGILGVFQLTSKSTEAKISLDEAENRVMEQFPGEIVEIELEVEGKQPIYEIEIKDGDKHYELALDGNTGKILNLNTKSQISVDDNTIASTDVKTEVETNKSNDSNDDTKNEEEDTNSSVQVNKEITIIENDDDKTTDDHNKKENTSNSNTNHKKNNDDDADDNKEQSDDRNKSNNVVISYEQALSLAKEQVDGEVVEWELEEDDGRVYYEIELVTDKEEVDIEIDAYTGELLGLSLESLFD